MPLLIQLTGSAIALSAFIAAQAGWITAASAPYLALNIIGSAALVISATAEGQWGFVILESAWATVSAFGLYRSLRRPRRRMPRRTIRAFSPQALAKRMRRG
jgi:hypothetical protein